ncbi:MAG: SCO family protein [Bacteroidota bacterium]
MRYYTFLISIAIGTALLLISCFGEQEVADDKLDILGEKEIIDGEEIVHTIPDFTFMNQDSMMVSNEDFDDKIYLVDFFFTSCPTICPKMTKQLQRVYEEFEGHPHVAILSHSIDTRRDSVPRLRTYAENIGVMNADQWHFVTGDKDAIFEIADDYFSVAIEDGDAAGGFDHSGRFILVDPDGRVRAFADGTNPEEVDRMMLDMKKLLAEYDYSPDASS